jgi:hypothetical protein
MDSGVRIPKKWSLCASLPTKGGGSQVRQQDHTAIQQRAHIESTGDPGLTNKIKTNCCLATPSSSRYFRSIFRLALSKALIFDGV